MRTQLPLAPQSGQSPQFSAKWLDVSRFHLVGDRPQPKRHCVRWGTSCPPPKGGGSPNFRPCLLLPNGWMDQDATWHGGRSRLRPHCARWGRSSPSPKRGRSPQFSAHVYCGETAGWMKMPLSMEVDLSSGHIVLDGDPAPPPQKGHSSPHPVFGPCLL